MKDKKFNIRRKMREIALQILFENEYSKCDYKVEERILELFNEFSSDYSDMKLRNTNIRFAKELIDGVLGKYQELDGYIHEFSDNWEFERIGKVDINILRLSIYELINVKDIPASVTINEAIEISKTFGDRGSYRFINGILNSLRKSKSIEKF
ncbi:MAG: transcription antitermination factor NusB [Candidatus Muirbacterium halophilum]|nr:transcription antitermination factor NusB [Candidatus Muirbacterium halophilum]MCK9475464.1 transcription antitermination factor NusB [Candidatus Muirbacterium halophilum]